MHQDKQQVNVAGLMAAILFATGGLIIAMARFFPSITNTALERANRFMHSLKNPFNRNKELHVELILDPDILEKYIPNIELREFTIVPAILHQVEALHEALHANIAEQQQQLQAVLEQQQHDMLIQFLQQPQHPQNEPVVVRPPQQRGRRAKTCNSKNRM